MSNRPRFAIATSDAYQCVLETFPMNGWQLDMLFVSPGDWMNDTKQVIARALELGVPIKHSPISSQDLADLGHQGCTALVVASYQWKIPEWQHDLQYAVNFHPAPLPDGRGPYPLVRAILEQRSSWGVTCHQINEKFDQGDILDAENFLVDPDECHESLRMKIQMAATRVAKRVASRLDPLWQAAVPQEAGSYWARPSEQERAINFTQPVKTIMRQIRAFGDLECMATINDVTIFIHRATGWVESHSACPGAVMHSSNLAFVVAAVDGLIAITEWSFIAPGAIKSNMRR